jgi:hypothetical protein
VIELVVLGSPVAQGALAEQH